jgi:hypothetical protein
MPAAKGKRAGGVRFAQVAVPRHGGKRGKVVATAHAALPPSPRSYGEKVGMRGLSTRFGLAERAPHPDPLPVRTGRGRSAPSRYAFAPMADARSPPYLTNQPGMPGFSDAFVNVVTTITADP